MASELLISKVDNTPSEDSKVTISKTTCSLKKGNTVTLRLLNNTKKIIWVTENKKLATVSEKGVVKGKKKGTVYIYAIADHKLYKCKVTVY